MKSRVRVFYDPVRPIDYGPCESLLGYIGTLLHEMLQFLNAVIQERTCLPKPIYFTAFLLSKYALQALLAKIEHYLAALGN